MESSLSTNEGSTRPKKRKDKDGKRASLELGSAKKRKHADSVHDPSRETVESEASPSKKQKKRQDGGNTVGFDLLKDSKKDKRKNNSNKRSMTHADMTVMDNPEPIGVESRETNQSQSQEENPQKKEKRSKETLSSRVESQIPEAQEQSQAKPRAKKIHKNRSVNQDDTTAGPGSSQVQDARATPSKPKKPKHKNKKSEGNASGNQGEATSVSQDESTPADSTTPKPKKRKVTKSTSSTDSAVLMPPPPRPDPNGPRRRRSKPSSQFQSSHQAKTDKSQTLANNKTLAKINSALKMPTRKWKPPTLPANSPFHICRFSIRLDVAPIGLVFPIETVLAEHLSPLVGSYFPPLSGLVLSYHNVTVTSKPPNSQRASHSRKNATGDCVEEDDKPLVWISASFLVFRPKVGQKLIGRVNIQSESFLGLLLWNLFSIGIDATRLGKSFKWVNPGSYQSEAKDSTETLKSSPVNKVKSSKAERSSAMEIDLNLNEEDASLLTGHWVYMPPLASPSKSTPKTKKSTEPVHVRQGLAVPFYLLNFESSPNPSADTADADNQGFLTLEGTLLSKSLEKTVREEEKERWDKRWGNKDKGDDDGVGEFLELDLQAFEETGDDGTENAVGGADDTPMMSGALSEADTETGGEEDEEDFGDNDEGDGEDLMEMDDDALNFEQWKQKERKKKHRQQY